METKYWYSKNLRLVVVKNEDGTLTLTNYGDGKHFDNPGMLINNIGGVEEFWSRCISKEDFDQRMEHYIYSQSKEYREAQAKKRADKEAEINAKRIADFEALKATAYPIPTTYENIGIVLRYLNTMNLGGWELPAMTIGYSCNQYDCDGKTASTMILDEPIDVDGDMVDRFQVGAPVGHLMKYRRA